MGGNNTIFNWKSVSQCSRRQLLKAYPLPIRLALLCWVTVSRSACFFFFFFFSTLIIFAHADWMKNWGKHPKQLSKTLFSFSSWREVGLHFRNELGEPACLVLYSCILIIMLPFKSSFCHVIDTISVIRITVYFLPVSWLSWRMHLILLFNYFLKYTCNFRHHSKRTHHRRTHTLTHI